MKSLQMGLLNCFDGSVNGKLYVKSEILVSGVFKCNWVLSIYYLISLFNLEKEKSTILNL